MVSLFHFQLMNHPTLKCIIVLFFLMIPVSSSLSFNFTPENGDVIYQGSARLSNNSIQLTSSTAAYKAGWATYAQPLHLWDRSSGNVTDFTTNFSFVINSFNSTVYGDGFTFFLTPNGSRFLENSTGGNLGLTGLLWNSTDIRLVAVEFDINSDETELPYEHVGIDVDSVISVADVRWWSTNSIMEGRVQEAWISYDSQSRNLSVVFTGFVNRISTMQSLSSIVDFRDHLPEYVSIGFSASTGGVAASQNIYSWSFSSNLEVKSGSGTVTPGVNSGNSNTKLMIGLVVGGSILVLTLGLLMYCLWKKRKGMMNRVDKTSVSIGEEFEQNCGSKKFAYNDLKKATNNFAEQDKLGEGGFGSVYKGYLKANDSYVAVKRISSGSKQGIKEFAREVKTISTLRHRNLVQLLGWCYEKNELLLVYDFMPNGSLDFHLFEGRSLLKWETRFRIAQGLAAALLYLHEEWDQYVLHRDIKSSNIMLDANFNVKLGDFGLAKLVDHEKRCDTTVPAGTWGYMAPEYVLTGKASKETDVFSFGVVALEIATGRKSRQFETSGDVMDLVEWVWNLYSTEKLLDAADHRLNSDFNIREIEQLLRVGIWCTHMDKTLRPSIRQVIRMLNFEAPLPALSVPLDILSLSSETNVSTTNVSTSN